MRERRRAVCGRGDGARTSEQGGRAVGIFSFAFQKRAKRTDERVLDRRLVGGWEGSVRLGRATLRQTKRKLRSPISDRETADLNANN